MATPGNRIEFILIRRPAVVAVVALGTGVLLGPLGLRLLRPQLTDDGAPIESFAEIALLICLFCVGLRLRMPMAWRNWRVPLRLATLTMFATAAMAAAAAHLMFDMSLPQALLLGAILAATDPVLASEVGTHIDADQDAPSVVLSAESGINNGLGAALVMLVIAMMGLDDPHNVALGSVSALACWSAIGGCAVGWLIGAGMARWITLLDPDRRAESLEEAMVFATAALAYGGALALRTNGFLAVFAAGVALSHGGRLRRPLRNRPLMPRLLKIASQLERYAWLAILVLLGALIGSVEFKSRMLVFAAILLLFIRPLAVRLGLGGLAMPEPQWRGVAWFTSRGIAPMYCLAFAINQGLSQSFARELAGVTLVVVISSILASAASALPLSRASPGAVNPR